MRENNRHRDVESLFVILFYFSFFFLHFSSAPFGRADCRCRFFLFFLFLFNIFYLPRRVICSSFLSLSLFQFFFCRKVLCEITSASARGSQRDAAILRGRLWTFLAWGFYLPSLTEFYRILPSFTEFHRVLPSFTGFYQVLRGFT